MAGLRLAAGILAVSVIAGGLIGATMAVGPAIGTVNVGSLFGPADQGENPGVVSTNSTVSDEWRYVQTTFHFNCWDDWCRPDDGGLTFKIQQANRSDFEWDGLYTAEIRDDSEVEVALYEGETYRLLILHPDGRIIRLDDYTARKPANVTVTLSPSMDS